MKQIPYDRAVEILTQNVRPVGTRVAGLEKLCGRILAEDITAAENVPCFARSPYDGYAFKSADTENITGSIPSVTLKVTENIRAGQVAKKTVTEGTAIRLMTGAPIPEGADCVCKYEDTDYTDDEVVIKRTYRSGQNIVTAGEDIRQGTVFTLSGSVADPGVLGILSSLGISRIRVYKRLRAGIITTGDEVVSVTSEPAPGMIRDSNRYIMDAAMKRYGARVSFIGHATDDKEDIRKLIAKGLEKCDVIISTGGVSAGDYDLVPEVMEDMGFEILADSVMIKPGMACVYGIKDNVLMLALSGNPASALTNLQCICAPALRKMAGFKDYEHDVIEMVMETDFENKSENLRLIRGCAVAENGRVVFRYPKPQGNAVISSAANTNAYALVGPRSSVLKGETVKGFMI